MDAELRAAYLARLGLEAEPPSADALLRLHRAQVEQVPYETLWIHTGEGWGVDVRASRWRRSPTEGRGGYCFHLNGAFSVLLESLGYDVTRHVGGVHGPDGPTEQEMANHLVLTVAGLPTDDNPDGTWYVDAGLGDALHEPAAPASPGRSSRRRSRSGSTRPPATSATGTSPTTRPAASPGMAWRSAPATMDDFAREARVAVDVARSPASCGC